MSPRMASSYPIGKNRSLSSGGCRCAERISTLRPHPFPQPTRFPPVPHLSTVVGLSDVGRARSRNEDSLRLLPAMGVAVVADGMGGHPGGDVASRIAAETASQVLKDGLPQRGDAQEVMLRSVLSAHEAIRAEGQRTPDLDGMGTTITALAVDHETDTFVLGHVGDSRAYRYRAGTLTQLTKDDTWVQERIDAQQLTPEQARRHPFSHLLTQCLGLEDTPVPHVSRGSVEVGDVYLLCSDGLVGMVEDQALADILRREIGGNGAASSASRQEPIVRALVDAANEAGGYDNITAVLVTIGPA
jgi:serine/threonine protein phosphatase PrpC